MLEQDENDYWRHLFLHTVDIVDHRLSALQEAANERGLVADAGSGRVEEFATCHFAFVVGMMIGFYLCRLV